jgi:transcription elongation factor GreA-like protein
MDETVQISLSRSLLERLKSITSPEFHGERSQSARVAHVCWRALEHHESMVRLKEATHAEMEAADSDG